MDANFYTNNRSRLAEAVNGGLVVVAAYTAMQDTGDMAARFTQESNFLYLTGISAPDWKVIIDGTTHKSWLVAPDIAEMREIFDGSQDHEDARKISGIDKIITSDEAAKLLRDEARRHSVAYTVDQPAYAEHFDFVLNPALKTNRHMLERIFTTVQTCNKELAQLRSIKQPEEIAAIQAAIKHTVTAFKGIHSNISTFRYEYEIEAQFSYEFRKKGLAGHAYEPIVAADKNACTLHYVKNNAKLASHQLVLMDVGAKVDGYAADITRTYAKGQPTKRQQAVFEAVERAHHEIISLLAPGLPVEEYHREVMKIMDREVSQLGLIASGDEAGLRKYFPHAISHGLGIDVHDSLGSPRFFSPNMVLTVEPGIYIPEESIGVRIEDDILITETSHKNLSAGLPTVL